MMTRVLMMFLLLMGLLWGCTTLTPEQRMLRAQEMAAMGQMMQGLGVWNASLQRPVIAPRPGVQCIRTHSGMQCY